MLMFALANDLSIDLMRLKPFYNFVFELLTFFAVALYIYGITVKD